MHVGIVLVVEARDGVEHGHGLVRGGGIVEVDQRPAVHELAQDRKVLPDPAGVERDGRLRLRRRGRQAARCLHAEASKASAFSSASRSEAIERRCSTSTMKAWM